MRIGISADHPDQLLLADDFAAGETFHLGDQRKIDLSPADQSNQRCRQFAAQLDLHFWKRLAKAAQNRGQNEGCVKIWRAQDHGPLDVRRGQPLQHLVVKPEDGFCVGQDEVTVVGEKLAAPLVAQERRVDQFFQSLQLQRDRGLGPPKLPRGNGDAAGLNHRHE